jgi:hypothetical protein
VATVALPFAFMSGPGLEVVDPMAVVLLGGLVTTVALSLFLLPALYARFGAGHEPEAAPEDDLLYSWAGVDPHAPATAGDAPATRTSRWRAGEEAPADAEAPAGDPAPSAGPGERER